VSGFKLKPLKVKGSGKLVALPSLVKANNPIWETPGVAKKPLYCKNNCPFNEVTAGICYDHVPTSAKIGVLLNYPAKDDMPNRKAWTSNAGKYYLKHWFKPLGYDRENILVSHVLRCYCGMDYPAGSWTKQAEIACRTFDNSREKSGDKLEGGLLDFDPDVFIVTLDFKKVFKSKPLYRLIQKDVEKAAHFADQGHRPLILSGLEVLELVAPWLKGRGGIAIWRGHFWEGELPFKQTIKAGFASATPEWRKPR
jgi:hypothetical protein